MRQIPTGFTASEFDAKANDSLADFKVTENVRVKSLIQTDQNQQLQSPVSNRLQKNHRTTGCVCWPSFSNGFVMLLNWFLET